MSATTLGWWRPANGCDHDDCSFVELDVAVWRSDRDDPEERLLRLFEALPNECVRRQPEPIDVPRRLGSTPRPRPQKRRRDMSDDTTIKQPQTRTKDPSAASWRCTRCRTEFRGAPRQLLVLLVLLVIWAVTPKASAEARCRETSLRMDDPDLVSCR
jgi:hypothetical protein